MALGMSGRWEMPKGFRQSSSRRKVCRSTESLRGLFVFDTSDGQTVQSQTDILSLGPGAVNEFSGELEQKLLNERTFRCDLSEDRE